MAGLGGSGMNRVARAHDRVGVPADVLERHGIKVVGRTARCPFHDDRTPSLSLFTGRDGKPRWRCFACDMGGDALDLEARLSGRTIAEVLR